MDKFGMKYGQIWDNWQMKYGQIWDRWQILAVKYGQIWDKVWTKLKNLSYIGTVFM